MHPPTEAQLQFLKRLGYTSEPPLSKKEASFLIDGRKAGKKTKSLEKALLKGRLKIQKSWLAEQRRYAKMEVQQARDSEGAIAGFRIRVGRRCDGAKKYHGAFLPTQVAIKHPELLPPYEGICEYGKCECEFEELLDSDRIAADTPMVMGPNKFTTVGKHRKSKHGCLSRLLALIVIAVVIYLVARAKGWL